MKRVLVTGASGFIGKHLVDALLDSGHEVVCLLRATSVADHLEDAGAIIVRGDVCRPESLERAVQGVEAVYHLAGLTKTIHAEQLDKVNCGGVENIARACARRSNPPVLLVVSSLAAVGPSDPQRPHTEDDSPLPVSLYGRSKREGELAAERWAGQVPISIVRPPVVLGEGDRDGLALFRSVIRWGIHYVPGRRNFRLSLVHAGDLARGLILVAQHGTRLAARDAQCQQGLGYYFVECEEQPTYEQLGQLIGQVAGRPKVRVLRVPKPLLYLAAGAAELGSRAAGRAMIFNLDKAREAVAGCWTCSAKMIRETLGFSPARPLAERLGQTASWYKQRGWV